ncbi:MAG: hypothetical protein RLZ98_2876 [Pseudomonadota bacterium]
MPRAALDRFRRRSRLRQLSVSEPATRKRLTVYYDTPDLDLHRAGLSLRVRREGRRWVQVLSLAPPEHGGSNETAEIECPVASAVPEFTRVPDRPARQRLKEVLAGRRLSPVFETDVWRTTRRLAVNGKIVVDLAVDRGEIRAGRHRRLINEVELAIDPASADSVLHAAEILFGDQPVARVEQTRTELGYALLKIGGNVSASVVPRRRAKVVISPEMDARGALAAVALPNCVQVLENWDRTLCSCDPSGPHQMRVALRRLRTAIRLLRGALDTPELRRFATEARDLARIVGRLRDADVFIMEICEPATAHGKDALSSSLHAYRETTRADVRSALADRRWARFRLKCMFFEQLVATAEGGMSGVEALSRKALSKSWRRVKDWGRRIDVLTIDERHEMRKDMKSLRYATEFFMGLYLEDKTAPFLKQLKRLQDVFGYLNDVATAARIPEVLPTDARYARQAAGEVLAWHETRAAEQWAEAKSRWKSLAAVPRFWK